MIGISYQFDKTRLLPFFFLMNPVFSSHRIRDVEVASLQLRRVYRVMRETMCAMSGRMLAAPRLETKRLLGRHAWIDSLHADALRKRVLELRYPRVDVEDGMPTSWLHLLAMLPRTRHEAEFLAGVHRVVKPRILRALQSYLDGSDEIDDAPTQLILNRIIPEIAEEIAEAEEEIGHHTGPEQHDAAEWAKYLGEAFDALGGFELASLDNTPPVVLERRGFNDRPAFELPKIPARDPSYEPAVMQVAPRPPANDVESRVWQGIDHSNETWAAELPAALIWKYGATASWDLLRDSARWAYDELRHAMMGERRMREWGFRPGIDFPIVSDHFAALAEGGYQLEDVLLLLHALELGGPKWKAYLVKEFDKVGDKKSSVDCDYDWADEAGHIKVGLDWTRLLFPKMTKAQVIERHNALKQYWADWMKKRHADGTHGYGKFLPRMEKIIAELIAKEGRNDLSKPIAIIYGEANVFDFEMTGSSS